VHVYERYNKDSIKFIGDPKLLEIMTKGVTSSHLLTIKWWYENTDEEIGLFFEDDVDFEPVKHWNFTLMEFIEGIKAEWGALHLCNVFEYPYDKDTEYPPMMLRRRNLWDHGLQAYALKREYAKKIIDYYFIETENNSAIAIHYKMPLGAAPSFENNVMHGFGPVYTFPLFNQNVIDFRSKNIYYYNKQADSAIYSYEFLTDWWEKKGSQKSLDNIYEEAKYE
jgi:hypothetical protein|tara:strand:- start:1386 stop:2054 length:669 start_codon:yes stop_codon:yes gene_type:complete